MTCEKAPELKQCPFCGETDYLERQHLDGTVRKPAYRIACDNCGASSRYTDHGDEYEVWNERRADVADAMVAAAYEAAAKTCDKRGSCEELAYGLDRGAQNYYRARNAIRALTPDDARAALAEAERKAWEAGRNAAAELIIARGTIAPGVVQARARADALAISELERTEKG